MKEMTINLGPCAIKAGHPEVSGQFVELDNEMFYRIRNYHAMPDFFISPVSDSNHWMFISSNGSLSAGRINRDHALFPYYTVDKIHDYRGITGSATWLLLEQEGNAFLWEPFSKTGPRFYNITRNIYKNIYGNKIFFEEENHDIGLTFRYGWLNSNRFGFAKKSTLITQDQSKKTIRVLDGPRNLLPHGIDYAFQNEYSNLLDAYKKNELVEGSTLGLYMLSSIPVDRAEPSEALKTNTVWSVGLEGKPDILLSDHQIDAFVSGKEINPEYDVRARRGSYYIHAHLTMHGEDLKTWYTIAEIDQDGAAVANLFNKITTDKDLTKEILEDVQRGTESLKKKVACADGFQKTNTDICYARHYSNTLYNIMRGGVYIDNYTLHTEDFKNYIHQINRLVSKENLVWLEKLPSRISAQDLIHGAQENGDPDLIRIVYEYLPLTFSRRHGDPSRPWNRFSIETKDKRGNIKFNYEGNWRDIFQNWEALSWSFPGFLEGIICKFLNASTPDGYNPYRIMRSGIEWESPDPDDPWAYIGYWGDHQIIYLEKLLETIADFSPGKLEGLLDKEIFTYANVPYTIKHYQDIVANPQETVDFNHSLNEQIEHEVEHLGADAKMLKSKDGNQLYRANMVEKILVSFLSKLCNFIPEAGIWMNTQRPEWNDANNALVGNGVSMVTLYYLRRALKFWEKTFEHLEIKDFQISEEVVTLFEGVFTFLENNYPENSKGFTDEVRKKFADTLGGLHSKYRHEIYGFSFSGIKKSVRVKELLDFTRICLRYMDQSIRKNKRSDGLYHAYNLISVSEEKISIRHLYEMLEGQVAVLSAEYLSPAEALEVLDQLQKSTMFREDQYSYMLYPDRELPRFIEKNIIPAESIHRSPLLNKLVQDNNTDIVAGDVNGVFHFNGTFRNADVLDKALDNLRYGEYSHLIEEEKDQVLKLYEQVFDHQSFTGRSGTFYGYEGLGSIYWHMVSKLLLAVQENYFRAVDEQADPEITGRLKDHYYKIKAGIGLYKSPDVYGAFPMDAYSHTPGNSGVKQPGLTGQVKEDVISRFGELGIRINHGNIVFDASLLNHEEVLDHPTEFGYYSVDGKFETISLHPGEWVLTLCQVPVVFKQSDENKITLTGRDGMQTSYSGNEVDAKSSRSVFQRLNEIKKIDVAIRY
jgi:hypothetical protein